MAMHDKYTNHDDTEMVLVGKLIEPYWAAHKRRTGETQAQFARRVLNATQPFLSNILKGVYPVSLDAFGKLIHELDIPTKKVSHVLAVCPNYVAKFRAELIAVNRLVSALYPNQTKDYNSFLESDELFESVPKTARLEDCQRRFKRRECSEDELFDAVVEMFDL